MPIQKLVDNLQARLFEAIVSNRLVYNTCWEDPRIDRALLQLDPDSRVVAITGAGDNLLEYLMDGPATIDAVDRNPAQNALLELKAAAIRCGEPDLLFRLFGEGGFRGATAHYRDTLRQLLPDYAREYWDSHIDYFHPTPAYPSFYYHGTCGHIALMVRRSLRRKGLYSTACRLLESRTLPEQRYYYEEIAPDLWNGFLRWLFRRRSTLALLGVPHAQRQLIGGDDLPEFIRKSMERVFTRLPISDNYFWRVYITGRYTDHCAPGYLDRGNFSTLQERVGRVDTHTETLSRFLERCPGRYTHFVLMDHQDWMAASDPEALHREWRLILNNSAPGARILFRSAAPRACYLPGFVRESLIFEKDRTSRLHPLDRVGTYGSTHLGIVTSPPGR